MRTRSSGAISPPSSPLPVQPVRGKKRRSTDNDGHSTNSPPQLLSREPGNNNNAEEATSPQSDDGIALTPRKTKRVRFSEPMVASDNREVNNTGLTPFMRKTRLSTGIHGAPRRPAQQRRVTLPPRLEQPQGAMPAIQEVQFAPLRQVLDSRMRRRLRRSHLSEEMNDLDATRQKGERSRRELAELRAQGHRSEEKIKELMFELESQRQFGIQLDTEEEEHAKALQEELEQLRQELNDRDNAEVERRRLEGSPTEFDEDENLWDDEIEPTSPLADYIRTSSSSPVVRDTFPSSPLPPSSPPVHAAVQTSFVQHQEDVESEQLAEANRRTSDAQAALYVLHNELLALGFNHARSTSEEVISSIKDAFRQTRLELEHLLPGETPGGFENVLLLPAMLEHVQKLLGDIRESRRTVDAHAQAESALRGQFNKTLEKVAHLENEKTVMLAQRQDALAESKRKDRFLHDMQLASDTRAGVIIERDGIIDKLEQELERSCKELEAKDARINHLENENRDTVVSIERLQRALQSYRSEVTSLEALVINLEHDKHQAESTVIQRSNDVAAQDQQQRHTLGEITKYLRGHLTRTKSSAQDWLAEHARACQEVEDFLNMKLSTAEGETHH